MSPDRVLTRAATGEENATLVWQWALIGLLLVLCLIKGGAFVHSLAVPADEDMVRDISFIQANSDGNIFGDPTNSGALRWYPPLVHMVAAGVVWLARARVMPFWIDAGPWLNLLSPLMFFVMNRRLVGAWPAVAATAVLVLFNSAAMPSDAAVGYTPFSFTPSLAWPMFFAAVWLIHVRADAARFRNALLIGAVLGLVSLAHTVPAILLSCIVTAVAIVCGAVRFRVLAWLAHVAVIEIAFSAPYLAPLIIRYGLHVVNPIPEEWVHPLLMMPPVRKWLIAVNAPGVAATILILWCHTGLERVSTVIFATWIAVCAFFLFRYATCAFLDSSSGVCGVFVIAVHHYHAYLQGAWASLIGFAISVVPRRWSLPTRRAAWAALGIAGVAGGVGFITQPWDLSKRAAALAEPDAILDRHAYSWILEHTGPDALFATPLPDMDARPSNIGPQAAAVIAAGRRLVAAPVRHANPFLDWNDRNARRVRYLNSLTDVTGETQALCAFEHEAGPRGNAFFLVPNALIVRAQAVSLVFRDRVDTIYRVIAGPCVSER